MVDLSEKFAQHPFLKHANLLFIAAGCLVLFLLLITWNDPKRFHIVLILATLLLAVHVLFEIVKSGWRKWLFADIVAIALLALNIFGIKVF